MKYFLSLLFLLGLSNHLMAQDSDNDAIETTVNYYLQGGTNNDFDMLKKAFHENATMNYLVNGEYLKVNAIEFFKESIQPGPAQKRKTRITKIDIVGLVANVRVEIEYETFSYMDLMTLMKFGDEWKVVGKVVSSADEGIVTMD